MRRIAILSLAAAVWLSTAPAIACFWDHDTLEQKRARFPTALELITGKFLRHSPEFYQWRIEDRLQKMRNDPDNMLYLNDLGVAYQKIGKHDKAIQTMERREQLQPHLYQTEANLATFYIMDGKLEQGVQYLDEALTINSHAQFDMEKYQKWLVEYALTKQKNGRTEFPLRNATNHGSDTFATFIASKLHPGANQQYQLSSGESQKALKAVLVMMHFSDYENPLLLEALGDLLSKTDQQQLGARAFLAASYKFKGKPEEQQYRSFAAQALSMQKASATASPMELKDLEQQFAGERKEADDWYAAVKAREVEWIRTGADVDREFDRQYRTDPWVQLRFALPYIIGPASLFVLIWSTALISVCWLYFRQRRGSTPEASPMPEII